ARRRRIGTALEPSNTGNGLANSATGRTPATSRRWLPPAPRSVSTMSPSGWFVKRWKTKSTKHRTVTRPGGASGSTNRGNPTGRPREARCGSTSLAPETDPELLSPLHLDQAREFLEVHPKGFVVGLPGVRKPAG